MFVVLVGAGFQSTRPIRGATKGRWLALEYVVFQSTRPIRGATRAAGLSHMHYGFQSTRPIRGATTPSDWTASTGRYFNPRAPYGARLGGQLIHAGNGVISIHAPHTGRDSTGTDKTSSANQFQSTRPIRGATVLVSQWHDHIAYFNPRAPYGARLKNISIRLLLIYFNPRAPYGARRIISLFIQAHKKFQSTRPIRGATAKMHNLCSAFLQQQTVKA